MARRSFYKQSAAVNDSSITTVLEVDKPGKFTTAEHAEAPPLRKPARWIPWLLMTGFVLIILTGLFAASVGLWYWRTLENSMGIPLKPLLTEVWNRRRENMFAQKPVYSILLLGLDQSKQLRETSLLTDTMVLVTIHESGTISTFSIPRDLWIDSLKTRINALYYYGQQTDPDEGVLLLTNVVSEIMGVPVDYYAMVNMDTVKDIIDAFGGVSVNVARPFEDKLYPREIDLSSKDPAVLYETVVFAAGPQLFDGTQALKYIRSRHSEDPIEGTDTGRELRQQQVLTALVKQTGTTALVADPKVAGALYKVWKNKVRTNLDDVTIALLANSLRTKPVTVNQYALPEQDEEHQGIIYHPKKGPFNQWVYLPVDPSWQGLKDFVASRLGK